MALEETNAEETVETVADTEAGNAAETSVATEGDDKEDDANAQPSVEDIASRMGWVPKEKFRGDEAKWKPASDFIIAGRDIQDRTARELREVRTTLETIKATNASIMEQRLREQEETLRERHAAAVAKGDQDEALKVGEELSGVVARREEVKAPAHTVSTETEDWIRKNEWFDPNSTKFDPVANERAVAICNQYARAKLSQAEQLAKTEQIIRREFPHLFPADDKGPASVERPGSRAAAVTTGRGKAYADMPKEAKAIADDLVERGLISDKEQYAKNYFAQLAKG
jgi:hypothetical protein